MSGDPLNIALITPYELARNHGTGAQLLTLLSCKEISFLHFYWTRYTWLSETKNSFQLRDDAIRIPRLRRFQPALNRWLGWWKGDKINRTWLALFCKLKGRKFDLCYVIVTSESDCERAHSIVQAMGLPYVVHIMDLVHENGVNPGMLGMARLLNGASGIIALSPTIREELQKLTRARIDQVPIGQPVSRHFAAAPETAGRFRIVMVGHPHDGGIKLLARSVDALKSLKPGLEIVYIGAHFPKSARGFVQDLGFIPDDDDYRRTIATAQVAYLTGPCDLDCYGRYSFPSRTAEFLMAGLPIIGCVPRGSATVRMLEPLIPACVVPVNTPGELVDAVRAFTASLGSWSQASSLAREFAIGNFGIDLVRQRILEILNRVLQERVDSRVSGKN